MLNTTFFKPVNLLIIGVVAVVFVLTAGKFLGGHVEKTSTPTPPPGAN